MRYFLEISYDGTAYHGWQIQENAHSIQAAFEQALSTLLRKQVAVVGQGRTDTGVHALSSWLHFDAESLPPRFLYSLNALLPYDLAAIQLKEVIPEAHARFSATARKYEYHLHHQKSPFLNGRSCYLKKKPDYTLMEQALPYLIGKQDFECFSKVHTDVKTFICTIHEASFIRNEQQDRVIFQIEADRFLRNMVRAIVGTLLEIGYQRMKPEDMERVIAGKSRAHAGTSVPACGLYLAQVRYPNAIFTT